MACQSVTSVSAFGGSRRGVSPDPRLAGGCREAGRQMGPCWAGAGRLSLTAVLLLGLTGVTEASAETRQSHLQRARTYLAATDYRRAIQACEREVEERPSAASYVYLTYVYQALSAYLDYLAQADRWVVVEQVFVNLATESIRDLVDPPSVLPRMAKEMLHESLRQQSDVTAAMATRLDQRRVNQLWEQQAAWRKAQPDGWWAGVPEEWHW